MSSYKKIKELRLNAIAALERGYLYSARDKIARAIEIYERDERYTKGDDLDE